MKMIVTKYSFSESRSSCRVRGGLGAVVECNTDAHGGAHADAPCERVEDEKTWSGVWNPIS